MARGWRFAAIVLLVAACGPSPTGRPTATPSGSPTATPSGSPTATPAGNPSATAGPELPAIADLRFSCGTFPFGADVLTAAPRQDQDAPTPEAAAVRREIALAPPESGLPQRGWRLVGADAGHSQYVAIDPDGALVTIAVANANGQWQLDQEGACHATVVLAEGIGAADWAWGSPGPPGPTTQAFDALVTERACASGRAADGRIVGPVVVPTPDMVLVFFGVHPLPGVQDCPSNPSTRVPVDLGQPLGNRKLLDGGHLPFGDPLNPQP